MSQPLGFLAVDWVQGDTTDLIVVTDRRTRETVLELTPEQWTVLAGQVLQLCGEAFAERTTAAVLGHGLDEPIALLPAVDYIAGPSRPAPAASTRCRARRGTYTNRRDL